MSSMRACCEQLAAILEYPTELTQAELDACVAGLRTRSPGAVEALAPLRRYLANTPLESVQEVYTHTFDLNPVCSLDVGYYLFGEDYQRGEFLARLRASQEEAVVESRGELPDHLPLMLRWLGRVHGSELYRDAVSECLLPALERMQRSLADSGNPYRGVVLAVAQVLREDLQSLAPAHERGDNLCGPVAQSADRGEWRR